MEKPAWQRRREIFNHDWLKNQFSQGLGEAINLLSGSIQMPGMEWTIVVGLVSEWRRRFPEAEWLIEHYEREMSPVALFKFPPLSRSSSETLSWLPVLIHGRWLSRNAVSDGLQRARTDVIRARKSFEAFEKCADTLGGAPSLSSLSPLIPLLRELQGACKALGAAIEGLRSRIEVV